MQVRKLDLAEHGLTRPLYEEAFSEDSRKFVDYYYSEKTSDNQIYVLEDGGEICSMAHLNPYTLAVNGNEKKAHYIVAVATNEDCRRRGYMAAVLKKALQDLYQAGEIFTFLMPASERIYEPFDFWTVLEQDRPYIEDTEGWIRVKEENLSLLSEAANRYLKERYQVYAIRDEKYYHRMLQEYESDGGKLLIKKAEDGTVKDFGIWVPEPEEKKPKIMVRILDVRRMLMSLRLNYLTGVCFTVTDPLVEENNRCLVLTGTEFSGIMLMDAKPENSEGILPIRALTDLIFGVKTPEELRKTPGVEMTDRMEEELKKIIPLTGMYLNEVV